MKQMKYFFHFLRKSLAILFGFFAFLVIQPISSASGLHNKLLISSPGIVVLHHLDKYNVPCDEDWIVKNQKPIICGMACSADLFVWGCVESGSASVCSYPNGPYMEVSINSKKSHFLIAAGSEIQVGDSRNSITVIRAPAITPTCQQK